MQEYLGSIGGSLASMYTILFLMLLPTSQVGKTNPCYTRTSESQKDIETGHPDVSCHGISPQSYANAATAGLDHQSDTIHAHS